MQFEILNYQHKFCQYKKSKAFIILMSCFILTSCGTNKAELKKVDATPIWFKTEKRFSVKDETGNPKVHPFFDLVPFSSEQDNSVNFFITTPEGSKHYYDIDLVSGRLFKKHTYCEQDDIWKSYPNDIHRPHFTMGVVPRLLDPLGKPQKIIVFGNKKYLRNFKADVTYSQRAKVVGGVILQFCEKYPCKTRDKWLSTLVLIAVNSEDPRVSYFKNIGQLKKKVNWGYFKAFMENGFGRTKNGPFEAPAFRMVGEVPGKEALRYAVNKGHMFKFKELRKLRNSCQKLYDYLWEGSKAVRSISKEKDQFIKATNKTNDYLFVIDPKHILDDKPLSVRNRFINQKIVKNVTSKEIREHKINRKKYSDFSTFFFNFYNKYADRYKTCIKFVKASSLEEDERRHWFFTFINGYMNMERAGFFYRCNKRAWVENARLSSGKRIFKLKSKRNCSTSSLDYAFDQIHTFNTGLRRSGRPYYRYVEYDNGVGGTHQKVQSWIYNNSKIIACSEDDDREAREKFDKENPITIFPTDLRWRRFTIE